MRVSSVKTAGVFKRFGSLEIRSLGADVDLVVMLGPNGSGKSSVFDAFLHWSRRLGRPRQRKVPAVYFDAEGGSVGTPDVRLHPNTPGGASAQSGSLLHVRTAHRNTPDVLARSVTKQVEFGKSARFDRMIDTDAVLTEHYQRLVSRFLPVLAKLDGGDAAEDLEEVRGQLAPVQQSLTKVLPHLRFTGLGNPTTEGSFYFTRDGVREFRYENLSGGEKAVFDLLLDVHMAATELGEPLFCIDEPELHLSPAVQASVLTELMELLPDGSQLWIATHSVGMIRRAFDVAAAHPDRVAFLDFGQVTGPAPHVVLEPVIPTRRLLQQALAVALDDLAGLLAPPVLVVCEGSRQSKRAFAWDERVYQQIFAHLHQRVDFISAGGKGNLEAAAALAAVIAPGTRLLQLRDRDDLTDEARARLLNDDPTLRILKRRSLESYLVDDEVLEALVQQRGARTPDAIDQLRAVRDQYIRPNGCAKAAVGSVFAKARQVLTNTERLGENKHQFSADVLAPLITPHLTITQELTNILDLPG